MRGAKGPKPPKKKDLVGGTTQTENYNIYKKDTITRGKFILYFFRVYYRMAAFVGGFSAEPYGMRNQKAIFLV